MSEQSLAYDKWIDALLMGRRADAGSFARSAIGEIPRIETKVRKPDFSLWGEEARLISEGKLP